MVLKLFTPFLISSPDHLSIFNNHQTDNASDYRSKRMHIIAHISYFIFFIIKIDYNGR